MSAFLRGTWPAALLVGSLAGLLGPGLAHGAFINFDNCLDESIPTNEPQLLQWVPLHVDAKFNRTAGNYTLSTTIYGNVTGQLLQGTLPPPDSPKWSDPNDTMGKIADVGSANKYSTLLTDFKVVTYDAYNAIPVQFCKQLVQGACPIAPVFHTNGSGGYEIADLPAFRVSHDFGSPYIFSTLAGTMRVKAGDEKNTTIACVSANITPDLGPSISGLITWLPAAILILKGVATLSAAIWSPWGSWDVFRWSSNYGRDEDLLRLVTPGFGDCLQYIQFVALTGALSLQYPGFYQPAVSYTTWSLLLFNSSFVSNGPGTQSLVDGIYTYNGTYGMSAMSELIGMTSVKDVWACMAIWLLVIAGAVVLLCQLGFFARHIYRAVSGTTEEDLRQKNLPFTLGNIIRLLFNFFILPIVALSLFQLVTAGSSPASVVVCAAVLLVIVVVFGAWILRVIFRTKPRTHLFDDMPTVLLYGPLYNTYSDSAAPFALVPVFITFMRGVALGAVQPSGTAQIIVLAICEVILILALNGFRPFQNQTSMNAYHTFFAIVRLIAILLAISFVDTLGVSEAVKGWIGYAILLLHACVLVFGFFLNALQTLIEVIARSTGVAGNSQTGAIRGSIWNLRMLKKRRTGPHGRYRGSMSSNAAMLQDTDARSAYGGGRSRSISASSQQLLNQVAPSVHRTSGFDNLSNADYARSPSADAENGQAGYTSLPDAGGQGAMMGKNPVGVKTEADRGETFYRPPRPRRATNDLMTPGAKTRKSTISSDFRYQDGLDPGHGKQGSYDSTLLGDRDSPAPAYLRDRTDSNENVPRTDYAVREVDQYFRGAALSDQPTRKLKTGPADPEGPAASAQSWFQRLLFGVKGKQKEPSKGFEVVRSSRMPKMMQPEGEQEDGMEMQTSPPVHQEPYHDSPTMERAVPRVDDAAEARMSPIESEGSHRGRQSAAPAEIPIQDFDFGFGEAGNTPAVSRNPTTQSVHPGLRAEQPSLRSQPSNLTQSEFDRRSSERDDGASSFYPSSIPPMLEPIETVGGIDMPSRFNSRRSANLADVDIGNTQGGQEWLRAVDEISWDHGRSRSRSPPLPRRSSRRPLSQDMTPSAPHEDVFEGFDSGRGSGATSPEIFGAPQHDERPSSFAHVRHHRAADSISRNSFGADAARHGTSAEIFGRVSPSHDTYGGH